MARLATIMVPGDTQLKISALGTTTASSVQVVGKYRIFAINSDQDISITFGSAASSITTPTANSYRIPANQQTVFDTGAQFDEFQVFNLSSSTAANIYIIFLSVT
jgi:hypothetical protein